MNTEIDLERVVLVAREEWARDPKVRDEFDNDVEAFVAFRRYEALGLVKILGARTVGGGKPR